jgi:hypothetical protein
LPIFVKKMLSKTSRKVVKTYQQVVKKLSRVCQYIVQKLEIKVVIFFFIFLFKSKGWGGGHKVLSRLLAKSFAVG